MQNIQNVASTTNVLLGIVMSAGSYATVKYIDNLESKYKKHGLIVDYNYSNHNNNYKSCDIYPDTNDHQNTMTEIYQLCIKY